MLKKPPKSKNVCRRIKLPWAKKLSVFHGVLVSLLVSFPTVAQIKPDSTLTHNSLVTQSGNIIKINGGTRAGNNLFHSFIQFNVPTGGTAFFNNSLDVTNIFSRVTGSSVSNIDGILKANGTASLFLLNPNGIIFGQNAQLNIGGSFIGTTASSVKFADGTKFGVNANTPQPLLTVSVPIGLGFGANPGSITVNGNGQGIRQTTDLIDTTTGLHVPSNSTLALVGGDVVLQGGTLKTAGGNIQLGSVGTGSFVTLLPIDSAWALGYDGVSVFKDVKISGTADVDASGIAGGNIQIWGRNITLSDGSQIESSTLGIAGKTGKVITINASELLTITGLDPTGQNPSQIVSLVYQGAVGNSGSINIRTKSLNATNGTTINASTLGQGNAGSVKITASDNINFDGVSSNGNSSSGAGSTVEPGAVGNGGNVEIDTRTLSVTNGAQINASTSGQGNAGSVKITASNNINFDGVSSNVNSSGAGSTVEPGAVGNGGNVEIDTRTLSVTNGAQINASTSGQGNAGSVKITASDNINFDGYGSSAGSTVQPGAVGNGGNVEIDTRTLSVTNGAQIAASTLGQGNAGSVEITASDNINFDGYGSSAGSTVQPGAVGNGGNVEIDTRTLSVTNGAQIAASTLGQGNAGSVEITASDNINFDGYGSGVYSRVKEKAVGNGGDIKINTPTFTISNGGLVNVETVPNTTGKSGEINIYSQKLTIYNSGSLTANSQGTGNGGNINILQADSINLDRQASITATTASGEGGNITLQTNSLQLRDNSPISATAGNNGNGGNFNINTNTIVALKNSNITADADQGNGGNIQIKAQGIFRSSDSFFTASSRLGINGIVKIKTPEVNPIQGVTNFPKVITEPQLAVGCPTGGKHNSSTFFVTGTGVLPPNPSETLPSTLVEENALADNPTSAATANSANSMPKPIVEAKALVRGPHGEFLLVAEAPQSTVYSFWQNPLTCHALQTSKESKARQYDK